MTVTDPLTPFFEVPNELLLEGLDLRYELDGGPFADRIPKLTPASITFGAFERLGYAETATEYTTRRDELLDAYQRRLPADRTEHRQWYDPEGHVTYDDAETPVSGPRDVYLYEQQPFTTPVETLDDLARELTRLTTTAVTEDELQALIDY